MKIRITIENPAGNVKGLCEPRFDLVFGEQAAGCVKAYIVDQGEAIPDYGPPAPYVIIDVRELAAAVAALREVICG